MGCAADDPADIAGLTLSGERVVALELSRPDLTDLRLDGCDLAGVVLADYAARRVTVADSRLRECVWSGGLLQDAAFTDCRSERLSLRFSTLRRVTFTGCGLGGADFYGATLDRVRFEHCDLTGAHFDRATVKEATFADCRLGGVTGALSLRGAAVDLDDLPALAPSLAREVGLRLT